MTHEEEKRHARLMNITDVVPSLSGIHYKVHPPKHDSKKGRLEDKKTLEGLEKVEHSAKSKALKKKLK